MANCPARRGVSFFNLAATISFVTPEGSQDLRLVHAYVHLGSVVAAELSLGPKISRRASSANEAYGTLSRQVFGRSDIEIGAKVKAVSTFVDSTLLYNSGPWHAPPSAALLEKARRRVIVRVRGRRHELHSNGSVLYSDADVLGVEDTLRRRRLLYLGRMVACGPSFLHGLDFPSREFKGSWANLLWLDLQTLGT